jgi:hypothetical protein
VQAARLARLNAQKMRQLAAERAERLERELKDAAESGLRTEISRSLDARTRLQAAAKHKPNARYTRVAALAVLLGVATAGLAMVSMHKADAPAPAARQTPLLDSVPGDQLKLSLSYSVSQPSAR